MWGETVPDAVWNWIAGIAGMVLLATLANLVLPKGSTYKSAQLVCGLVVIAVIADPLLRLLSTSSLHPIAQQSAELAVGQWELTEQVPEAWRESSRAGAAARLEREIQEGVCTLEGYESATVTVEWLGDEIETVTIRLDEEAPLSQPVAGANEPIQEKIYEFLRLGYDITPGQVCIE